MYIRSYTHKDSEPQKNLFKLATIYTAKHLRGRTFAVFADF